MKQLEDFFPDVLTEVPGCGPDLAKQAIRNTLIEFCEKTMIYQVTLDPITLLKGVAEYDIDPPEGYRVHRIMKVWLRGSELSPIAPDMASSPEAYSDFIGGYSRSEAQPTGYLQRDSGTVTFLPIPDQRYANAVTMRVALAPLRSSQAVEDFLFEQWGEVIAFGAKARLMLNPGKPFTNVEAATVQQARYISGRNDALQRALRGNVRSDLRVRMRKI